jgi:iron complex outermembrane recepter protein
MAIRSRIPLAALMTTTILSLPVAARAADTAALPATATSDAPADRKNAGQANDTQSLTTADIVVTGSATAEHAPVTASLTTTQPQAVVNRNYIDHVLPATADFNMAVLLTPGVTMNGNGNGPGLAESKIQIRGFQDGEYNVTYDSVPFGDTNNPTHHSTSFFPSNTIETVVVDRGPGNASQLGQATYGGNLNIYSRAVTPDQYAQFDAVGGSFGTFVGRAEYQTGHVKSLNGAQFVVTGQYLRTDGALTYSPERSKNVFAKAVIPIGEHNILTVLGTYNRMTYYQSDTGYATCGNITGENCAATSSIGLYGKNFGLSGSADPSSRFAQDYWKYNRTDKKTDFEIVRLQSDLGDWIDGLTLDNRAYMYGYTNHTLSGQDATGGTANSVILTSGGKATVGVPGYTKLNKYRTYGYIGQINYDFSHGRLRVGGWYEHSDSSRNTIDIDLATGAPNYREGAIKYVSQGGLVPNGTPQPPANIRYQQDSGWDQFQLFGEFEYRPLEGLSITPGIKYVHFTRNIDATVNQTSRTPINAQATFTKALPFATVNYAIKHNWSAYFQFAKGMYVPDLSSFYSPTPTLLTSLKSLQPQTSTNYQLGTVLHGQHVTFDADVYKIDVNNKIAANPNGDGTLLNIGTVHYKGIEGQISYFVGHGLTLFTNGSLAEARSGSTGRQIAKAPYDTAALGLFYQHGRLFASFSQKFTGPQYAAEYNGLPDGRLYRIGAYSIGNLAVNYTVGRYRFGINVDNIFNDRSVNTITTSSSGAPTTKVNGKSVQSGYGAYDSLIFNSPRSIMGSVRVSL